MTATVRAGRAITWQTPEEFGEPYGLTGKAVRRQIRMGRIPARFVRNTGGRGKAARYLLDPGAAVVAYAYGGN